MDSRENDLRAFTRLNSVCGDTENDAVSQFFHILSSAMQINGAVKIGDKYEKTIYSVCYNAEKSIYYYKTYYNSRINAIDMNKAELDGKKLISYPFLSEQDINFQV